MKSSSSVHADLSVDLIGVLIMCVWIGALAALMANRHQSARSKGPFRLTILLIALSSTACIVSTHLFTSLIFAHLSVLITLYLVALWAHRGKGNSILITGTFFLIFDSAALFSLTLYPNQQLATKTLILLTGFSRLLVPLVGWWFRTLDRVSPVFIVIIFIGLIAPCGIALVVKGQLGMSVSFNEPFQLISLSVLVAGSFIVALLNINWHRKDFAFFSASIFALYSPAFFFIESAYLFVGLTACLILATLFNLSIYNRFSRNKQYCSLHMLMGFCLVIGIPGLGPGTPFWLAAHHHLLAHPNPRPAIFISVALIIWLSSFLIVTRTAVDMSMNLPASDYRDEDSFFLRWPQFIGCYSAAVAIFIQLAWWAYDNA